MMNIVQVGSYPMDASIIKGGVEASVYGLANTLSKEHYVDVFDLPRLKGKDCVEKSSTLCVHRYANNGTYNKDACKRVDEIIRDIIATHPDVVHVHGTGEISSIIYKALKEFGIKVLVTVHGLLHVEKKNMLKHRFSLKRLYQYVHQTKVEFSFLESLDRAIVDTEYVALKIVKLFKLEKLKKIPYIHVIPQGIDNRYYGLKHNSKQNIILSVGSFSKRKGHLLLIKAFEQVCKNHADAQLIIAGFVSDSSYYKMLLNYVSKSAYKQRIKLLVNLNQDVIDKLYTEAKIFALHSQEESQGIVFAEAMALGLPIVSTNVGGIPDVVKNRVNGYLVDYGNINDFANNIETILADTTLCEKMKRCNIEEANSYNWDLLTNRILSIYKEL